MDLEFNTSETSFNISANRSGFIRVSVADEVEDEAVIFPRPELREGRRLSEKIKLACARTSEKGCTSYSPRIIRT